MLREERERWEDMTTGSQGQGSRRLAGNEQFSKNAATWQKLDRRQQSTAAATQGGSGGTLALHGRRSGARTVGGERDTETETS